MSIRQRVLILLPFVALIVLGILVMPDQERPSPALPDQQDLLFQSVTFAMVGTNKAFVLGMDQSPAGRKVLEAFHNTRRFDLIPYREELQREMLATLDLVPWPE
jgi:hypothetical protein